MKKEYIIYKLSEDMKNATRIENELFKKFDVKRGLHNEDGTGVLVGLTKIGNVVGYERIPLSLIHILMCIRDSPLLQSVA